MIDVAAIASAGAIAGLLQAGTVLALGAAFRLMRFPDITVEGSFLIGAAVWAALVHSGWPPIVSLVMAGAAGAVCGAVTGALHDLLGLDRFLAGILVTAACYSVTLLTLGASNIGMFGEPSQLAPGLDLARVSLGGALVIAMSVALPVLAFFRSRLGLRVRAAASNPQMFLRSLGATFPYVAAGLAFTNALAAVSGAVFGRHQGFVDVGMGQGVLITALAALAIGEAVTRWIRAPMILVLVAASVTGSVLYQWALTAALVVGCPAAMTKLVTAAIVLLFLALQVRRETAANGLP